MNSALARIVLCLLIGSFWIAPSFAQSQAAGGTIEGTITDESGAVMPNVTVEVRNVDTNLTRALTTGPDGRYLASLLPSGVYFVVANATGFATAVAENVQLFVGGLLTVNVQMKVAGGAETITVGTQAPLLETSRTTFTTNLDMRSLHNLPIVARNFETLVLSTPGAVVAGRNTQSIGGAKGINSNYTVDGADRNNPFFGGQVGGDRPPFSISLEAIKEFAVLNNGYNAEFGRSGGGLVNVVTKSGTNEFHGGAWYYLHHRELVRKDETRPVPLEPVGYRHQWGGNVGGPLAKDKLFFYFNTDHQYRIVPLRITWSNESELLAGLRSPDANTRAAAQFLLDQQKTISGTDHLRAHLGRVDWLVNTEHMVFGRYNYHRSEQAKGTHGFPRTIDSATFGSELDRNHNGVAQWNWIVTPRAINEFRYNYSWEDRPRLQDPVPGAAQRNGVKDGTDVQITGITSSRAGLGAVRFLPIPETDTRTQFTDNFSYVRGKHDFKFGGDYNTSFVDQVFRSNARGRVTYGIGFGRSAFENFVAGTPTRMEQSFIPGVLKARVHELAFFGQDNWKLTPNFTLNWGLRWEGQINPSSSIPNPDFLEQTRKIPNDLRQWVPRFGFAWSVKSKTVIRLWSGLFYARTPMLLMSAPINENGDARKGTSFFISDCSRTTVPCPRPFVPPNYGGPYEIPFDSFPSTLPAQGTIPGGDVRMIDPDFKNSRTFRVGPSVEFEVFRDATLSVQYSYSFTTHLQRLRDVNLFAPTISPVSGRPVYDRSRRPFQFANFVVQTESTANARYNALTIAFNKRYSQNFQLQAFYTYARSFSHDDNERDASFRNVLDPKNLVLDWGRSNLDIRHNIVSNGVWSLPWGFQISALLTARSGVPWNVNTGTDSTTQALLDDSRGVLTLFRKMIGKPNAVVYLAGNGDGNTGTDRPWVDGKPFPRNFFSNTWFFNWDMRVTKTFRFNETRHLELLADLLNVTNRANRTVTITTPGSAFLNLTSTLTTFGQKQDRFVGDPFSVQLGAKFVF